MFGRNTSQANTSSSWMLGRNYDHLLRKKCRRSCLLLKTCWRGKTRRRSNWRKSLARNMSIDCSRQLS